MSATLPQIDAATFALLNADAQQALLAGIRLLDNTLNAELIAAAATMTVGTYDAITMFPRELKHIYSNYTSWVSLVYLFTRFSFQIQLIWGMFVWFHGWRMDQCDVIKGVLIFLPAISLVPAHLLFSVRVWSIWAHKKWVLLICLPPIAGEFIAICWLAYGTRFETAPFLGSTGACIPVATDDFMLVYWIPVMSVDTVLVLLATAKLWTMKKSFGRLSSKSIIRVLLEQSLQYYIWNFLANIINLIWSVSNYGKPDSSLLSGPTATINILLSLRCALELREFTSEGATFHDPHSKSTVPSGGSAVQRIGDIELRSMAK